MMGAVLPAVTVALIVMGTPLQSGIHDITWRLGPNLPEYRKGGCGAALDGKVISVFGMRQPWGEMNTMYVFDPEIDWWSRGPSAPVGQCYVQGAECGDAFYAIGGRKGQVRKECYRLEEDGLYRWKQVADLNQARGWAPSVAIGSKLYVFGGAQGGHGPTLNDVETLDTAKPGSKWRTIASIPGHSRGWLGAAAAGGKVYVFGGSHFFEPKPSKGPDRKQLKEMLEFDPKTANWKVRSPLPYRLSGMDCCVYEDRYIIVVGGAAKVSDFSPELRKVYEKTDRYQSYYCPFILVYDTKTDRWNTLPSVLPMPTNDIRVVLIGNKLYIIGGENIEPATSNTTAWFRIGTIVK